MLSQHSLFFNGSIPTWDEGLPLGNGILGSLVWGSGEPLNISLDRADLWDLRPVPEFHSPEYSYALMRQWHREGRHADLSRVHEAPYDRPAPTKIPAGRIELLAGPAESFHLDISAALATVKFDSGAGADIFVHAGQPLGMLRLRGAPGAGFRLRAPAFGGPAEQMEPEVNRQSHGSLTELGYPAPQESSGENFLAFTQTGWEGFHFSVYLAWRRSGEETVAAWSIASSLEGEDTAAIARGRVEAALGQGFAANPEAHRAWWSAFWAQSSLTLPDAELERQWYLETYKFGAAARRGAPPITLQGPWTADDGGLPPWKGDYHHNLNTQLSYWPCYSGNRLEGGLGFLDWLWDTRANCVDWTRRFFDMPGLNVPMTADLLNNQIGGWRQYTHVATTAAWLAQHFYLHWRYSADREFLRERAYPYLRDSAVFIEAVTTERGENGLRTLPLSSSPEINDNRPEAWFATITNYDLALIRWLLEAAAELAAELNEAGEAARWRAVLDEMPGFALAPDGGFLVAAGAPLTESHRHFSHLMAIHPLGLVHCDDEVGQRTIGASLAHLDAIGTSLWCGYSFSWLGNMAARAGDGERAAQALKTFLAFTLPNSFHVNGDQSGQGYSTFTYRPFTLEGNFAFAAGIQEMLLQSWRGVIRVFPAIPAGWTDISFQNLRAEGAFLVSAELRDGGLAGLRVEAEVGGLCRLQLPHEPAVREMRLGAGEVWEL